MKTNLAYIDETIDREMERRHAGAPALLADTDRKSAAKTAIRVVAGFEVYDEQRERDALDEMIAKRRAVIDTFRADRTRARVRLGELGVTPLAIIPLSAWEAICDQVGLFRLSPDKQGRVGIKSGAFNGYMIETKQTKHGMFSNTFEARSYKVSEVSEFEIEAHARKDWAAFLKTMFGGLVAPDGASVALVLPTPPAGVADILLKASSKEYLGLKVAAVAEAISFRETPAQILRSETAKREAEARRQERFDADPIIFYEEGTAAAIIAQFGDFPIEQQVVDAVVASDKLIAEKPKVIEDLLWSGRSLRNQYLTLMQQQLTQQSLLTTGLVRNDWMS